MTEDELKYGQFIVKLIKEQKYADFDERFLQLTKKVKAKCIKILNFCNFFLFLGRKSKYKAISLS